MYWAAQAVGAVGICMLALSFVQKQRKTILAYNIASAVSWTIHFLLLSAFTGAAMNALSIARSGMFYREETLHAYNRITLILLVIGFFVAGVVTWKDATSILPMIAMTLSTVGLWQRNPRNIRLVILLSVPFWITYNVLHGSIAGVIAEIMVAASSITGLYIYAHRTSERTTSSQSIS